jgi:UDP-glucuronate 4-epimerase
MKVFITGIAGMIGYHTAKKLIEDGHEVWGIDNFNDYYDPQLKQDRENILVKMGMKRSLVGDIDVTDFQGGLFEEYDIILHLAAYANPRHAMEFPEDYVETNIMGTEQIIRGAKRSKKPVVYASSSCVMHGQPLPWKEELTEPHYQNNPYGWSKYVNECQFSYANLPAAAGLRFFTVYGPYGRPDMALFDFTRAIVEGEQISAYNNGEMFRDWTYVEDIVQGIILVLHATLEGKLESKYEIFNIGYGAKTNLMDFIKYIGEDLGREPDVLLAPMHPADTPVTWADTSKLQKLGYNPTTPLREGVTKFVEWYKEYYNVN